MLESTALDLPGVAHGFFTREGGVSRGLYEGLNCGPGSGDDPAAVRENRAIVALALKADTVITAHQIHSPNVVLVRTGWDVAAAPQADALITQTPRLALGALAADCVPVLFAAPAIGAVASAHAGWKGTLDGVVEATVGGLRALGARPDGIHAAIGPAIQQKSYEMGPEVRARFATQDAACADYFEPGKGDRWQMDLPGLVEAKLQRLGLGAVDRLPEDTYTQEARFFSYRRATHRNEPDYGRQISAISLTGV